MHHPGLVHRQGKQFWIWLLATASLQGCAAIQPSWEGSEGSRGRRGGVRGGQEGSSKVTFLSSPLYTLKHSAPCPCASTVVPLKQHLWVPQHPSSTTSFAPRQTKTSHFYSFITHRPGTVKQWQPAPGPKAGLGEL